MFPAQPLATPSPRQRRVGSAVLSVAIKLASNCHAAYLKANPKVRRRFNDAVLQSVYIEDGKVARAQFTEVFEALFSRPGSNKALSVERIGLEPTTPCLQSR